MKTALAIPTPDRSATTAARALYDNVFLKLDFPSTLLSDREGEFLNVILREVLKLPYIKQVFTSIVNGLNPGVSVVRIV